MKVLGFFLITCSLFFSPVVTHAEYRVFLLKFTKKATEPGQPEESRFVESTLDPEQYSLYHTVDPSEKISYVDTWRCYGRTDHFKAFCPNPRAPASDEDSTADQDQISPLTPPAR